MRVSSYQLLDAGIRSIQQQSVEAMKWQQQISSGNRYSRASEGAVAITRGVEIHFDQSKYKMLKANQDFVATRMALADAQLGAMHDVLADMQQMGVQARDAAIGKIGLQSLAQRARAAYEQLAQQAVAMDTNEERYLLRTTTVARLDQPKTTVSGSDSVAQQEKLTLSGTYAAHDVISIRMNGVDVNYAVTENNLTADNAGGAAVAGNSATAYANIAAGIAAAYNASTNAAHTNVTATAGATFVTFTADEAGESFVLTASENSAAGEVAQAVVQPNVASIANAVIAEDAIFVKAGEYVIDGFTTRLNGDERITEARLQINGRGPVNNPSGYYVGVFENGVLKFPQQPEEFMNLSLRIEGTPDSQTRIEFYADPVTVELDPTARLHQDGDYQVRLNKGDQFDNVGFMTTIVSNDSEGSRVDGWELNTTAGAGGILQFTEDTPFDTGYALKFSSNSVAAAPAAPAEPFSTSVLKSTNAVDLFGSDPEADRAADQITFRWAAHTTGTFDVTARLRNTLTGEYTNVLTQRVNSDTDWSIHNFSVPEDGNYELELFAVNQGAAAGTIDLFFDEIKTISGAKEITSATLLRNGVEVSTVEAGTSGLQYNANTRTTQIDFGAAGTDPENFYDLRLSVVGDPVNMRTTDTINFRVDAGVKRIEVEPGIWVPEGISFREALGNTTATSRDVLADALAFVESLERAAVSGTLETDFTGKMAHLDAATDQVLQYQIRAGVIGAQVDAAKAALETKATELEAHRSRLLDTDIAEASAGLVRTQTLLEAARSIFARLEASNLFQRLG